MSYALVVSTLRSGSAESAAPPWLGLGLGLGLGFGLGLGLGYLTLTLTSAFSLKGASPRARETEKAPLSRGTFSVPRAYGVVTCPPAATMRALSAGAFGLWSSVRRTWLGLGLGLGIGFGFGFWLGLGPGRA